VTADLPASIADCEAFTYGLPGAFACIQMSMLVVVQAGPLTASVKGEIHFGGGPELAGSHPHHKHVPPDIKHHRVPAPGLSFQVPNLPFLIREVEQEHLYDRRATAAHGPPSGCSGEMTTSAARIAAEAVPGFGGKR